MRFVCLALALALCACNKPQSAIDESLAAEINSIRAIDNHAHPVRNTGDGSDRYFDALPVDNMEPQTDPLHLRPSDPVMAEARKALYGGADKQKFAKDKGDQYPAWVLDQMGVDIMLANRVEMGSSIQPPRFRWVPYVDTLLFPLDNSTVAAETPDKKLFFVLEDLLGARYHVALGRNTVPPTLADYLAGDVTATLERHRAGGAVAEKFEAAYLRTLDFEPVDRATADRIYATYAHGGAPAQAEYKPLQDFLFHYIAAECGRLGMAVHLHTMAGAGSYFNVAGAEPTRLESVLNDPALRKTKFVMVHGGWPYTREAGALLQKPNAWLDFSAQDLILEPATLAVTLREWLEFIPEKVMFGTDAYPYIAEMGWEESGWIAARNARRALAIAVTGMMRDGEITRARASELAKMVLHDNAKALYGL